MRCSLQSFSEVLIITAEYIDTWSTKSSCFTTGSISTIVVASVLKVYHTVKRLSFYYVSQLSSTRTNNALFDWRENEDTFITKTSMQRY